MFSYDCSGHLNRAVTVGNNFKQCIVVLSLTFIALPYYISLIFPNIVVSKANMIRAYEIKENKGREIEMLYE